MSGFGEEREDETNRDELMLRALVNLANRRPILSVKAFDGYEQDPNEWIQNFERSTLAHGLEKDESVQLVSAYLKGEAASWYHEHSTEFARWDVSTTHPERQRAFRTAFLDRFRTKSRLLQWQLELDQRKQQPEETVEQYARVIQRLLRNVDPDHRMSESLRIHTFTRGLQPAMQLQITNFLTYRDNVTFSDVVAAAQQFERSQNAHLQAITQPTQLNQPVRASLTTSNDDALVQLTKQMEQLMRPMVESVTQLTRALQQRPNLDNRQRNPQQTNWSDVRCYNCGQYGHLARACQRNQGTPRSQPPHPSYTRVDQPGNGNPSNIPATGSNAVPVNPNRGRVERQVHYASLNEERSLNLKVLP